MTVDDFIKKWGTQTASIAIIQAAGELKGKPISGVLDDIAIDLKDTLESTTMTESTHIAFNIRRPNGSKVTRVGGVKTPEEALEKWAKMSSVGGVERAKEKGYYATEIPVETDDEIKQRMSDKHAKWLKGPRGQSLINAGRNTARLGESMRQIRLSSLLKSYDFITRYDEGGESEGSPQELGIKPGDIVGLPVSKEEDQAPDVDPWTSLAPYKVLPDLGVTEAAELINEFANELVPEEPEESYAEVETLVANWLGGVPGTAAKIKDWLLSKGIVKPTDDVYVEPGSVEHGVADVFVLPDGDVNSGATIVTLNSNGSIDTMKG